MANEKLTDKPVVKKLSDSNSLFVNAGGKVSQIPVADFRDSLNNNDSQVLNELAFFIDINEPFSNNATKVNVGGNMNMRQLWEDSLDPILLDEHGNYCLLNRKDSRYTADGELIIDANKLNTHYDHLDVMGYIKTTYGRVQEVPSAGRTISRLWLSLSPLPGGFVIPPLVVGKFKGFVDSQGRLRSIPGVVPTPGDGTVKGRIDWFWNAAQKRSKNHGLANEDFRAALAFYSMSKYGQRDCQNTTTKDGTLVWGVGLDGTESVKAPSNEKFNAQKVIVTGATLSLGTADGKANVSDANGDVCHSVNVWNFENVWGQYWEMVQGLCSVGTTVYCWRSNFVPSTTSKPTDDTFKNVDHVKLIRSASPGVTAMNIITGAGQGVYMVPKEAAPGVSYSDNYWYDAAGQLWLFGGHSINGSSCGIAYAYSNFAWSNSNSSIVGRLAYYGPLQQVSSAQLRK